MWDFIRHLSKKNRVDLIYTDTNENLKKIKFFNKTIFVKTNKIKKIFNGLYFLIKFSSIRVGYFFSKEMKEKVDSIHQNYDCIIFHSAESGEFLPTNYDGKKILEMTDLKSNNYFQLYKKLNFFNPLKYLYFIEYF